VPSAALIDDVEDHVARNSRTMKRVISRRLIPALAMTVLATAACAEVRTKGDAASEVVVQIGRESYVQYCSSCHGADGRGGGPVAQALKAPPPDLMKISERREGRFDEKVVASLIDGRDMPAVHGTREMPVWGKRFSERMGGGEIGEESVRGQLLVLIEYLRSIQR
jgi:mono/diheme cytochrome c family protein